MRGGGGEGEKHLFWAESWESGKCFLCAPHALHTPCSFSTDLLCEARWAFTAQRICCHLVLCVRVCACVWHTALLAPSHDTVPSPTGGVPRGAAHERDVRVDGREEGRVPARVPAPRRHRADASHGAGLEQTILREEGTGDQSL